MFMSSSSLDFGGISSSASSSSSSSSCTISCTSLAFNHSSPSFGTPTTVASSGCSCSSGGSCSGFSSVFRVNVGDDDDPGDDGVKNNVKKQPIGRKGDCEANEVSRAGQDHSENRDTTVGQKESSENTSAMHPFTDENEFTLNPQNNLIAEQILEKYGDVTKGSILKSTAAKSTFLQLVADVVRRLCNLTLDIIDHDELQLMQTQIDDAVAVGFRVDWLQARVKMVTSASEYQVRVTELDELGQEIKAAKKSLVEMELRQKVWKEEVESIKAEMEENGLGGSNLGEGLL